MAPKSTRREIIAMALAAACAAPADAAGAQRALKDLHERVGGRLGVHVLDSQSGKRIAQLISKHEVCRPAAE